MTDMNRPHRVTAPGGKTTVIVMDRKEGFPSTFALMATTAPHKVALRLSGGCKGMSAQDKLDMIDYFLDAFRGYEGMVWSGATRSTAKDGTLDPMVTDLPGFIAAANPDCVALGSAPRTDILSLQDDSRLVLDSYGTGPNPSMSGVLIVQNGADGKSDWDGDLDAAFGLMQQLRGAAKFSAVGVIAWNGGPITKDEVLRSAKNGWPTCIVNGSGRVADELAAQFAAQDPALMDQLPKNHKFFVADRSDPATLRAFLAESGFLLRATMSAAAAR
jgi:hypothetical protein